MTLALDRYRQLDDDLVYTRWLHQGDESKREDELLEEMEKVWWQLDDKDRESLEMDPPRSLIRGPLDASLSLFVDTDVESNPLSPPKCRRQSVSNEQLP